MSLHTISTDPLAQKRGGRGVGRLCTKASWGGVAGGWGSRRAERPGKIVGRRGQGLGEASVLEFAPFPLFGSAPAKGTCVFRYTAAALP